MKTFKVLTREEYTRFCAIRFEAGNYKCFSKKGMMSLLSTVGSGCWRDMLFLTVLVNSNCIKRIRRGTYSFAEPVSYEDLAQAYHQYASRKKELRSSTPHSTSPIEEAITLLKKHGYTISKREFDVEAAMQDPSAPVEKFIKEYVC